jgi:PrtD family type I secretion system ABC transporter
MPELLRRFRPFFVHAAAFSLVINLLLLLPSIFVLQVFDRVLSSRSNETLVAMTALAVVGLAAGAFLDALRGRLLARAGILLDRAAGPRVFAAALEQAAAPGTAEHLNGLRDVATLRAFLAGPGIVALFDLPWLPVFVIVIALFHPLLGVLALASSALLLLLAWLGERGSRPSIDALQNESRDVFKRADSALRNADVIAALGMAPAVVRAWSMHGQRALGLQLAASDVNGTFSALVRCARQGVQVAMMAVGAYLVINLHTTAGVMIASTLLLGRALAPLESVLAAWKGLIEARGAYLRLRGRLELCDGPQATPLPPPAGALQVERLVFVMRGHSEPIIKGLSFSLAAGESLAVIGPSASGKSTLARLLVGTWRPAAGAVRLDGADLQRWPRPALGPHIGYLPQDVELFPGTVSENIARGGEIDGERVVRAATRAGAHAMILRLPKGYDTALGEAGGALSGGQRQRIALARALYGDPRLVVLDEPNASLDGEGELALIECMRTLTASGVTLIVITHRPSLLAHIEKVMVLQDGRIESFGARGEVLARVAPAAVPLRVGGGAEHMRIASA